ncbi:MAG: cation:proton antiporter [Candidatus Omnitrophica bacterium]|nr:cation:proton antiporter [Candidatus Omnitrophota bacterium]
MLEILNNLFTRITLTHLNVLLLLGLALFSGTVGGRLFQKIHIPQVVGYIAIGIVIGESGFNIVNHETILALQPFNYFALVLIGFMIGGELKRDVLQKYGKQFLYILLFEGITAFLLVTLSVTIIGGLIFKNWAFSCALGLLLGAISSATAPAATSEVLREYKTRGPLTRTVLGIVALDDGLALFLFAVAASLAGVLVGGTQTNSLLRAFINPLYEILGAFIIGGVAGFVLTRMLRKYVEESRLLAFSIGTLLITAGLSLFIHIDMLLAAMTLGAIVVNFTPRKSKDVFKVVEGFTPPIYVLFFVLVGAKLNLKHLTSTVVIIGITYLLARTGGKALGAYLGARISRAPKSVQKYLPLCLLSQAGVAIGLSILASHYFPGEIGNYIVLIITATAFILEIIGPAMVRIALMRAKEVGLNITEEDLIYKMQANELMDKNPPLIYRNMGLTTILEILSNNNNLYFPVVDENKKLLGVISFDNIRNIFLESGLNELLLAVDVMDAAVASVSPETMVSALKETLNKYNLEFMPVVDKDKLVVGFIERRMLNKFITTKIMELQRHADSLEADV